MKQSLALIHTHSYTRSPSNNASPVNNSIPEDSLRAKMQLRGNAKPPLRLHRYRYSQVMTSLYGKQKVVRALISLSKTRTNNIMIFTWFKAG